MEAPNESVVSDGQRKHIPKYNMNKDKNPNDFIFSLVQLKFSTNAVFKVRS